MWRLRGALLLLGTLLESTLGQRVGFYAPQYELLDPRTGRSISQGFKIVRQPVLEQRSLSTARSEEDYSTSSSKRPEREVSNFFSGYFKPEGFKFPAFAASIRPTPDEYHSSPTYFTQDRERSGREDVSSVSSKGFVKPLESSGFFSSDESEPNFFRMFGSGFKNEPSPLPEKYRFTRHSFPEYRPDPTPARSKRRPAEDIFSLKSLEEPISNELVVAKSPERYKTYSHDSLDSNNFNGDFAHKWRKKYPYYGRKKRSAEPMLAPWTLLDPITGRPRESREGSSATSPNFGSSSSSFGSDFFFTRDSIPSQFLETHNREERFNFNFRPTESHRSNSQQQQTPKSPYLNYAGRPIYKNHRKYPYYG